MNFIFRSYPTHPWFSDWSFEPRGCNSTFRENSEGLFFQSQETVGRLIPNTKNPEWALQIPVPQNSQTNMLFNGFCAYFEKKKGQYGAEVLVPEPGVLWGRFVGIPAPVIASDLPIEQGENFQWLESDTASVYLIIRDDTFCLISKSRLQADAIQRAETYFLKDFEETLQQELNQRDGANVLFEEMVHHDSLAVICAETMMKALRPAEGSIPLAWCQSSKTDEPMMNLNELPPLALAWRLVDINVAEELISCALKIQSNSGAIPVLYSPHTTHSVLEAPKPILAKTIEQVWDVRKDDVLLDTLIPPLRRHLQWLLHHFDPKRRGTHCWKNRSESITPDHYESDLETVDLTILLLTEIEALNRLQQQSSVHSATTAYFEEEYTTLKYNVLNQFWNGQESAFSNAVVRDKIISLTGFPAFTPLLWNKLPTLHRTSVLERIHESGTLPGGISILSWRKSALDDNSFPILQQLLVFQGLKTADPNGQLLRDFSRITLQGFVEWHSLSLEESNSLHINPVMAAYIMSVQSIRQYRYHGQEGVAGFFFKWLKKVKADRFDVLVIAATIFTIFSVRLIYSVIQAPPPLAMLEAQMNSAYANREGVATMENCMAIIKYYPDDADIAKLMAANISMIQQDFSTASTLYESIRQQYPDSPGSMIGLGLAYQMQGKYKEAEKNYYEFCYIFDEIFPELVGEVNHYRYLMQEGFSSPPKWLEIYRYQLMHEL